MNITSPCIHVCKLDDSGVCVGCHRTRDEISQWLSMTKDERTQIMSALQARARSRQCEVTHE